jgi:NNP family nitrate/nitrite transporter-like MFS transporter
MGIAKESTGSYQWGFATFGGLAVLAFVLVGVLHQQWLAWALPQTAADLHLDASIVHAE